MTSLDSISSVQLLDAAGNVLRTASVEPKSESPPRQEPKLATHLDWYRDATKWFVASSGGAIVFGFGAISGTDGTPLERSLFIGSSVILLASILGGILCHLWILRYANAVESLGSDVDDALRERLKKARTSARRWVPVWYYVMMWGFLLGMGVFTVFGWMRVSAPKLSAPLMTVVPVTDNDSIAAVIDPNTRRTWLLRRVGKELRWQEVGQRPPNGPKQ